MTHGGGEVMLPVRTFDRGFAVDPIRVWSEPIVDRNRRLDRLMESRDFFDLCGATDVYETVKALVVQMSLPGFQSEDISITEQHGVLTIRAEQRDQRRDERDGMRIQARQAKVFQRSFSLPAEVDADRAEATLQHGILTVTLPKARVSAARRIPITGRTTSIKVGNRGISWLRRLANALRWPGFGLARHSTAA